MAVETLAADAWLETVLGSDQTLLSQGLTGAFAEMAPTQQPVPFILWTNQGALDITTVGWNRISVQVTYLVRAVHQARDFGPLQPMADQIDRLLHGQMGNALGRVIQQCVREAPYQQVEDRGEGIQWRHLGGRYQLWVSSQ